MVISRNRTTDVLVIGVGMSGMAAASELSRAGRKVMVVDKGRAVGGRMASRRIGEAVFDHGAQLITSRSDYQCGDHCGIASLNTALASGTAAAVAILEDLP